MKHIYVTLKAVCAALILNATTLWAQSPTTVIPSNQCHVVEDFNATDGGFRSPSIYTESSYIQFNWDQQQGYWTESSGLADRSASVISGVYENKQSTGGLVIGFKYEVPAGSEYRIRVIKVNCACTGGSEVIATTANGPVWTPLLGTTGQLCIKLLDQDLIKGQQVRFEISIRNTTIGNFIIDDFSLTEIAEGPLPVTFLGMLANRSNNIVSLKWDVADEVDVKEYHIERRATGSSFTTVGAIPASGQPSYTFSHTTAEAGTLFYRIKNVDRDGKFKYSSIVRLNGSSSYASSMKLYPIPAINKATIEHKKLDARAKITVATIEGKVLKTITPANGASHTPIHLSDIPKGVYIVRLEDGQGKVESAKLIKK